MTDVVIVEAVRTPVGRRGGGLSTMHPADLLATCQQEVDRAHGHRSGRGRPGRRRLRQPGRRADLQHRPHRVARRRPAARRSPPPRSTRSADRPSRPRTSPRSSSARASSTSRVGLRRRGDEPGPDRRRTRARSSASASRSRSRTSPQYELTSQFEGAERIADKWGITREDTDEFGLASPAARRARRGPRAASTARSSPVDAPDLDEEGKPTGTTHTRRARRRPPRDDAREAGHAQAGRPGGRRPHRRLLVADLRRRRRGAAHDRGARRPSSASTPRARIVDTCLVGVDPVLMLTGPIDATAAAARAHRPVDGRHRRGRDQRGVRLGRAGLGEGARRRHGRRSTRTAAPSPSATRSAAPAPS